MQAPVFFLLLVVSFSSAAINRITHPTGEIFVKGINVPWFENQFRHDIAPSAKHPDWGYWYNGAVVTTTFQKVKALGFNVVRFWVCEGLEGLKLDNNGRVSGTDPKLWTNLDDVINRAKAQGLMLYLTILSAQVGDQDRVWLPLSDSAQQAAMITHVFKPLATRYKGNNAIFAIDLMNEIQSDVTGNTGNWGGDGATWDQARNWIKTTAAAIKTADAARLVTCSSGWHEPSAATVANFQGLGLDFYDLHSYDDNVAFPDAGAIATDKPIIIGEYGPVPGGRSDSWQGTVNTKYLNKIRNGQFAGGFAWEFGSVQTPANNKDSRWAFLTETGANRAWVSGFSTLLKSADPAKVTVSGTPSTSSPSTSSPSTSSPSTSGSTPAGCVTDIPPAASPGQPQYTCAEQAGWGKCGESWMQGYCKKSCPAAGTDIPPAASPGQPQYTCAEQAGWGKCGESWMQGYCKITCAPTCSGSSRMSEEEQQTTGLSAGAIAGIAIGAAVAAMVLVAAGFLVYFYANKEGSVTEV